MHDHGRHRHSTGGLQPWCLQPGPELSPLGRLARLAYRRRGLTLLAWVVALVAAFVLSSLFGGKFAVDYSAPGSDSRAAQQVLQGRFLVQSVATVTLVVHADAGVAGTHRAGRGLKIK